MRKRRQIVGSTGTCTEVVKLGEKLEPDYDGPVSHKDLAAVLEDMESVPEGTFADIDPRGNDAFAF
jgi:hypothetical protein